MANKIWIPVLLVGFQWPWGHGVVGGHGFCLSWPPLVLGLMGFACYGRCGSWVWWVLLATLSSTSLSHWWRLRFLGLIFGFLGLWSSHVVVLQIDFWISEISRIYLFILFAMRLIFGWMLIVVVVEVSFGLWWRQPVLIVGVVVAGWIYLWWLWVKRKRERE